MNAIENWERIDYDEIIEDLNDDIATGVLTPDAMVYVLRQDITVKITGTDTVVEPVFDFFYNDPELLTDLKLMSVLELKKLCYATKDFFADKEASNLKEALTETLDIIVKSLSDYTKNNSKRNNEICKVVLTKENETYPSVPLLYYFENESAKNQLELIKVSVLLEELIKCNDGCN